MPMNTSIHTYFSLLHINATCLSICDWINPQLLSFKESCLLLALIASSWGSIANS